MKAFKMKNAKLVDELCDHLQMLSQENARLQMRVNELVTRLAGNHNQEDKQMEKRYVDGINAELSRQTPPYAGRSTNGMTDKLEDLIKGNTAQEFFVDHLEYEMFSCDVLAATLIHLYAVGSVSEKLLTDTLEAAQKIAVSLYDSD